MERGLLFAAKPLSSRGRKKSSLYKKASTMDGILLGFTMDFGVEMKWRANVGLSAAAKVTLFCSAVHGGCSWKLTVY
jgi:hypothetical protein